MTQRLHLVCALALALAIFALDALSPMQGAVAVLYTTVILIAAQSQDRALIVVAGMLCTVLTAIGYCIMHWGTMRQDPAMRFIVTLVAIGVTTLLCLRRQAAVDQRVRSEERYRTIFDAAGFPIWEVDWSGAYAMLHNGDPLGTSLIERASPKVPISDANGAAARLFGFNGPAEFIAGDVQRFFTPGANDALVRVFEAFQRGEMVAEVEVQFETEARGRSDLVLRVTLLPTHQNWNRVLVMGLDVTERNQAIARFDQSQAALMHVSRVTTLGQLVASIAHEVNQPLSAIITYAKSGRRWLAREAPDAAEVADCLDHIALNGARAADVIDRVRALASNHGPATGDIDLRPLIDETVALLSRGFHASDIVVRIASSPSLPAIIGDRVQVQQVLMNLLLNAEQAMVATLPGQRVLSITAAQEGDDVTVSICDGGGGIADVNSDRLFSPFFTTKPDGLGMGLSICRSIIEQHGGSLRASNNPDRGATFLFRLPAAQADRRVMV